MRTASPTRKPQWYISPRQVRKRGSRTTPSTDRTSERDRTILDLLAPHLELEQLTKLGKSLADDTIQAMQSRMEESVRETRPSN